MCEEDGAETLQRGGSAGEHLRLASQLSGRPLSL